jgi:hypothetical protein
MKKIRIISLICAVLITLSACGKTEKANETSPETPGADIAPATNAPSEENTQNGIQTAPETHVSTEGDNETDTGLVTGIPTHEEPSEYSDGWVFASMADQILASDESWNVTGSPLYENGYLTSDGPKGFDVAYMKEFSPEETYRFEFELKTGNDEKALYVGLGIASDWGLSDENNGLWLYFSEGKLCIQDKNGSDACLPLKRSVTDSFSRICLLVQKMESGEQKIHVFQSDENGLNERLYILDTVTENGNTAVYAYSAESQFNSIYAIADLGFDLQSVCGGYVKLWNDGADGTCVKNLALKVI